MRQRAEAVEAERRVTGGVRADRTDPDRVARGERPGNLNETVVPVVSVVAIAGGAGDDRGDALGSAVSRERQFEARCENSRTTRDSIYGRLAS